MIIRKSQKGQSIIEFALILPLFLLLLFGMIYFSMIMADYISLNNIARSSAREAAVTVEKSEVDAGYPTVKEKYKNYKLPIDIYNWDVENDFNIKNVKFNEKDGSTNVVVTINVSLNENGLMFADIVNALANIANKDTTLNITYTMYSEYKK